ncbi:MAG TPA: helix-turn-helix domain-containing protein [Cyclobacteriaceae bacterium]
MQESFNSVLAVAILIGAVQGLFLAIVLAVMRKGNRRANLFLAALLFTNCLGLLDGFLDVTNSYARYPRLIGVLWPGYYLVGPSLYFYVKELSSSKRPTTLWIQLLHILPAVVSVLFLLPFYFMNANEKVLMWASMKDSLEGLRISPLNAGLLSAVLQKVVYLLLSFRLIAAYSARIKQSFSSIEKISLSWLRTLLALFFALCFFCIFYALFSASLGISREAHYSFYLALTVVTFMLALKVFLQPEIFSRLEAAHRSEVIRTDGDMAPPLPRALADVADATGDTVSKGKYHKSRLTDERAAEIERQLVKVMEIKKPFLEPELTLTLLSDVLSVSPHHLSQVINSELNKSFFDFVNEYRVQETKRLLISAESSRISILGIALDAGFNSKSAFYSAFTKRTGMTPSEFRKQSKSTNHSATPNSSKRTS